MSRRISQSERILDNLIRTLGQHQSQTQTVGKQVLKPPQSLLDAAAQGPDLAQKPLSPYHMFMKSQLLQQKNLSLQQRKIGAGGQSHFQLTAQRWRTLSVEERNFYLNASLLRQVNIGGQTKSAENESVVVPLEYTRLGSGFAEFIRMSTPAVRQVLAKRDLQMVTHTKLMQHLRNCWKLMTHDQRDMFRKLQKFYPATHGTQQQLPDITYFYHYAMMNYAAVWLSKTRPNHYSVMMQVLKQWQELSEIERRLFQLDVHSLVRGIDTAFLIDSALQQSPSDNKQEQAARLNSANVYYFVKSTEPMIAVKRPDLSELDRFALMAKLWERKQNMQMKRRVETLSMLGHLTELARMSVEDLQAFGRANSSLQMRRVGVTGHLRSPFATFFMDYYADCKLAEAAGKSIKGLDGEVHSDMTTEAIFQRAAEQWLVTSDEQRAKYAKSFQQAEHQVFKNPSAVKVSSSNNAHQTPADMSIGTLIDEDYEQTQNGEQLSRRQLARKRLRDRPSE